MFPASPPLFRSPELTLLRRLFSRAGPAPAATPAQPTTGGALIYAVGDVHGRRDVLDILLAKIRADAALAGEPRPVLIFIGDYVDRGPDTRGVVETVLALARETAFEVRPLRGNHEAQLLAFLEDPRAGPAWLEFGGGATLASYGVTPPAGRTDETGWEDTRRALAAALPDTHLAFFKQLEVAIVCGDYLFVHAGVRPGVPLNEQSEHDLLWIRDEFLSASRPFEKVVVHGHTPEAAPYLGRNRIGIDTGAYATATLTCVRLCGVDRAFIQATVAVR
jgi:serine/threonine protein phosphatase 1